MKIVRSVVANKERSESLARALNRYLRVGLSVDEGFYEQGLCSSHGGC
jgi:hypothetical protein